jgi:hypothetical protein
MLAVLTILFLMSLTASPFNTAYSEKVAADTPLLHTIMVVNAQL